MNIIRFADSKKKPYTHWIEDDRGNRHSVDEDLIEKLYWGSLRDIKREDDEEFTIFKLPVARSIEDITTKGSITVNKMNNE